MKLNKKQQAAKDNCIRELKVELESKDTEVAHSNADLILCELLQELGMGDVVDVYSDIDKWYT